MKKLYSIMVFCWVIFLFLSACGDAGYGLARITDVYDKGPEGLPHWRTVIHCVESDHRYIIEGKVGRIGEVYMSSHC